MKKPRRIPKFQDEDEEREFWATHDATEYFDLAKGSSAPFPNLQPSTQTISLRLPEGLLADLKVLANRMDVPYQSLMKLYLAERVGRELREGKTSRELASEVREPGAPYGRAKKPRSRPRRVR